jgi:hypothetical protein
MSGVDRICGTHMVYLGSPEREEATVLLLPHATLVYRADYSCS